MHRENYTEEILLRSLLGREPKVWKQWYAEVSPKLFSLSLRYMKDQDSASEVLQSSFLKIFSSLSQFTFRGEGSLRAWASRIVVNEALAELKRQGRLISLEQNEILEEAEESPEVETLSSEEIQEILSKLPDGYRVVFNLYVLESKSHKEIAGLLGITQSTSASQFHRAKKMLAQIIKEYQNANESTL